jgi:hypothetical protein
MRRAKRRWRRGLLLVEAVLAAGVIATGLVLVSRSLGGQLSAIGRVEERDAALALGRSKLAELEAARLSGVPESGEDLDGTFDQPFDAYGWSLRTEPREDLTRPDGTPLAVEATLTIKKGSSGGTLASLAALWPASWTSE